MSGKVFLSSIGPGESEDAYISFSTTTSPYRGSPKRSGLSSPKSLQTQSCTAKEVALQVAPVPLTRFFFPEGYDTSQSAKGQPFFQHFDVRSEIRRPPDRPPGGVPEWAEEALQLSLMKASNEQQLQSTATSQPLLSDDRPGELASPKRTVFSVDSEQWIQDMRFCTWVATLRPRKITDGENTCILMGGVIQWLVKQLNDTQKAIHGNMTQKHTEDLAAQKAKLWAQYHALRMEDEGRLQAKLDLDCVENLRIAKEHAMGQLSDDMRATELHAAKLQSKIEELEFEIEQLKKSMTDTHAIARKYEDMMNKEKAAHEETRVENKQATEEIEFVTGLLDKARQGALERILHLRGPALWHYAADAVYELTAARAGYMGKVVNLGVHDSTGVNRIDLLTVSGKDSRVGEPHFAYLAASKEDKFLEGKTMLQGQGVSFSIMEDENIQEIDLPSVSSKREVFFFKGELLQGAYFAVPLKYLGMQTVGILCVDTCVAHSLMDKPATVLLEEEKNFVRQVAAAAEAALATDELDAEAKLDPDDRLSQLLGLVPSMKLEKCRKELEAIRDILDDSNQFHPSDLAEVRSQGGPPPQSFAVFKAALHLTGFSQEATADWEQARLLLTQEFIIKVKNLSPDKASSMLKQWKLALLELRHADRVKIQEESPATLVIYKWFLALQQTTSAFLTKKRETKERMGGQ